MAWRTTPSPLSATRRRRNECGRSVSSVLRRTKRPVNISAQVEALTNSESLRPRCASQSAPPIFSAISRSAVAASGIRNSASARHSRIIPRGFRGRRRRGSRRGRRHRRTRRRTPSTSRVAVEAIRRRRRPARIGLGYQLCEATSSGARARRRMAVRSVQSIGIRRRPCGLRPKLPGIGPRGNAHLSGRPRAGRMARN